MKIKWLGQSTFIIKSDKTLVTDPYNPMVGKLPPDLRADIVTVSHQHMDHNFTKGVGGSPKIIDKISDFEVDDIKIRGVATFHDNENGKKRGENIVYTILLEGLKFCHLGDLGHKLSEKQIKDIGEVDILMIPVGGFFTIDAEMAKEIVGQLNPKVVLPMHFKPKNSFLPIPIAGVEKFVTTLGWSTQEVEELEIDNTNVESFENKIILFK